MIATYLGGGVLLLWIGGEAFVYGSVTVAKKLRLSELMIGLTLVAFGSSLPELITSLTAALAGAPGLAVGNVVGSNIANVLLILGIAALIRPVICHPAAFYRDALALTAATLVGTALILYGVIGRVAGAVLVAALLIYIVVVYRHEKKHPGPAAEVLVGEAEVAAAPIASMTSAMLIVSLGLAGVIGGAWLLVEGATGLALAWGVSRTFIGLTIVAVGTSLPELVISGVASMRGRSDVALGNILGSNMFNLLAILGVTGIVVRIDVPPELGIFDVVVMPYSTSSSCSPLPRWSLLRRLLSCASCAGKA